MDRETRRIDPQFDEVPDVDMLLQDWVGDLESLAVFGVHSDTIDQYVAVGESLLVELLAQ